MFFEHDVFISYAHLNNRDDEFGQNGWVAKFHARLKNNLTQMLGRDARIWRDNKLPYGATFSEAIRKRLRKSRVLLCVVSPNYINSTWCIDELREFRLAAEQNGGLFVGEQSRIITVVKSYLPPEQFPPECDVENALYSEFFETCDDMGGVPLEFGNENGGYKYNEYEKRVRAVAWAIKKVVEELPGDEVTSDISRTIYLAETTSDRSADRNQIKSELEIRNFVVLPNDSLLKDDAEEYRGAVREHLQRSFMSIHLLGKWYGVVPEGAQSKSVIQIQNEEAARRGAADDPFKRLIWIPESLEDLEPSQSAYLTNLRENEEMLSGAQLLEQPFENLKTRVLQVITKERPSPPQDNLMRIYLMCDKCDDDSVEPVGRFLYERGYEVIPPPEDEEEGGYIKYHKESLLKCDATITVYGKTTFAWVQDRHDDVIAKSKGWGRASNIHCEAILPTDPKTSYKSRIFFKAVKVLPACYDGLSSESLTTSLDAFISELDKAVRA